MSVQPLNGVSGNKSIIRNYYNLVPATGYGALGLGGLCLLQGIRHKKSHKALGLLSVIFALGHLALIELMKKEAIKNSSLNKIA